MESQDIGFKKISNMNNFVSLLKLKKLKESEDETFEIDEKNRHEIRFSHTKYGGIKLYHQSHGFLKVKDVGDNTYWRCCSWKKDSCPVRLVTTFDQKENRAVLVSKFHNLNDHTHDADPKDEDIENAIFEIKVLIKFFILISTWMKSV